MAEQQRPKLTPQQLRKLFAAGILSAHGKGDKRKVAYDKAKASSIRKTPGGGQSQQKTRSEVLMARADRVRAYLNKKSQAPEDLPRAMQADRTLGRLLRAHAIAARSEAKAAKPPETDPLKLRRKALGNRASTIRQYAQQQPRGSERQQRAERTLAALERRTQQVENRSFWKSRTPEQMSEARAMRISDINQGNVRLNRGTKSIPAGVRVTAQRASRLNPGGVSVRAPYNQEFIAAAKSLGGKWDSYEKTWTFSSPAAKKKVAALVRKHYGSGK